MYLYSRTYNQIYIINNKERKNLVWDIDVFLCESYDPIKRKINHGIHLGSTKETKEITFEEAVTYALSGYEIIEVRR